MKIFDITRTMQEAPLYPGSEPPTVRRLSDTAKGDPYTTSVITAGSHIGTHADAFCHCLADSGVTIDKMPLENYCGRCRVLTVPANAIVTLDDIRGRLGGAGRVALHGGGKSYLCEEAAEYIARCGVKALVTDAWSPAPLDNELAVHEILFRAGVAVIENAVLDGVEDGEYMLFAFPVKYGGCDGAPVRAVLLHE